MKKNIFRFIYKNKKDIKRAHFNEKNQKNEDRRETDCQSSEKDISRHFDGF